MAPSISQCLRSRQDQCDGDGGKCNFPSFGVPSESKQLEGRNGEGAIEPREKAAFFKTVEYIKVERRKRPSHPSFVFPTSELLSLSLAQLNRGRRYAHRSNCFDVYLGIYTGKGSITPRGLTFPLGSSSSRAIPAHNGCYAVSTRIDLLFPFLELQDLKISCWPSTTSVKGTLPSWRKSSTCRSRTRRESRGNSLGRSTTPLQY